MVSEFFTAPLCYKSITCVVAWCFFLFVSGCLWGMFIQYPVDESQNNLTIKCIIGFAMTFFIGVVSRCCCMKDYKELEDARIESRTNFITYNTI